MMNRADNKVNKNGQRKGYDILPRILCLVAAFILWLYVTQVETADFEEVFNGVSVELVNTSVLESEKGLYVYSGYGNTVNVTVTGRKSDINRHSADNIRVYADVSGITESGRHTVPIIAEAPTGLTVSNMSLSSVAVYVDEKSAIEIDVLPKITSAIIGDGLELGELIPEYNLITVTGPKTVLDNVDHAQISLELGNVTSSVTTIGKVELVSKTSEAIDMRYVQINRNEMSVTVPVTATKEVPVSISYKHGLYNDRNVEITFDPATLVIKGDPKELEAIESVSVGTIDEKLITSDVTRVHTLNLPEGITTVENIETVDVAIKHIGTAVRSFAVDNIKVTGNNGKDITVQTKSVSLRLRGPQTALERVKADDITVTVDMSGYSSDVSGTVSMIGEVTVSGAPSSVYAVGEYLVQVKIG